MLLLDNLRSTPPPCSSLYRIERIMFGSESVLFSLCGQYPIYIYIYIFLENCDFLLCVAITFHM